jgi:hypothetical protein
VADHIGWIDDWYDDESLRQIDRRLGVDQSCKPPAKEHHLTLMGLPFRISPNFIASLGGRVVTR